MIGGCTAEPDARSSDSGTAAAPDTAVASTTATASSPAATSTRTGPPPTVGSSATSGSPTADPVQCPDPTVTARSAAELTDALAAAGPGTVIAVADGTYAGNFTATTVGTEAEPVFLCGGRGAVLDAGGIKGGYVLHLDGAAWWRVVGLTVRNGQKGVMADGVTHSVIQGLHVSTTGDEAIHLRRFSTDNVVADNDIDTTGLRRDKFGEGVYVGSADSNWCTISGCEPDRSDSNQVIGNRISATGSESVDVKEGTTGGVVRGNTFDGTGMTGADSWVDIKGSDWLIEGNAGTTSPLDGYQTHQIGKGGWGDRNVFRGNSADLRADGFGFAVRPALDNVVSCDNTVTAAGSGLSTVDCTP